MAISENFLSELCGIGLQRWQQRKCDVSTEIVAAAIGYLLGVERVINEVEHAEW
jgi:hypothetical protein